MQETNQQEETKPNYSKEDYELIAKGIRPEHMPQEDFKFLRKMEQKITKDYMRGSFEHVSQGFTVKDENGKPDIVYTKKGKTYIKSKQDK